VQVLCSVAQPALAVGEMRRVLRTGGRLLFLEHVQAPQDAALNRALQVRSGWGGLG
jgi:ubiquinone/menaquinone biosynthesis C-methylase UbiE